MEEHPPAKHIPYREDTETLSSETQEALKLIQDQQRIEKEYEGFTKEALLVAFQAIDGVFFKAISRDGQMRMRVLRNLYRQQFQASIEDVVKSTKEL